MPQKSGSCRKAQLFVVYFCALFLFIFPSLSPSETADPAWYDTDWDYRKKITIDHTKVAGDLTDYPFFINIASEATLAAYAQDDGDDIFFTDDTGTKLDHEIEAFNGATGALVAHVRISSLSSGTDTAIYIYYGNLTCGNQENPEGVWDSDFEAVWHLSETSGTRYDSTSNDNDLTDYNTVGSCTKFGGCADFETDNTEYLSISDVDQTGLDKNEDVTYEAWANLESTPTVVGAKITQKPSSYFFHIAKNTKYPTYNITNCAGLRDRVANQVTLNNGTWYYLVGAFDISIPTGKAFINASNAGQNVSFTLTTSICVGIQRLT